METNTTNQNNSPNKIKITEQSDISLNDHDLHPLTNIALTKLSVRPGRSLRRKSIIPNRLGISNKQRKIKKVLSNI